MEGIKIRENFRQVQLKAEEIRLFNESFVIVPYQVSGFIDYSNRGSVNGVYTPEDFETFKRVWTGNDACIINWKNSLYIEQTKEKPEGVYHYKLGEIFLGTIEVNSFDNDIRKDKSFSEYTTQQQINTVTFRVSKIFNITDYYNFMFYKIPELSGSTLYRVESIEKDFVGKTLIGYVITFRTINQELANTGRARQQNIMPCAPGQGYLECIVKPSKEEWIKEIGIDKFNQLVKGKDYYELYGRIITADWNKTRHVPIKKVVVKMLGNGLLSSFVCVGRPVKTGGDFRDFGNPRLIFPIYLSEPSTPTLFNSQNNNNNFFFGDFKPTLEYFKDLMTSFKDSLTPINKWNYQGWLIYDFNSLERTNPKVEKRYKYTLYGNLIETNETLYKEYWRLEAPQQKITTTGIQGLDRFYNIGGNKQIHDHLFDNFFTTKEVSILPINTHNTLVFKSLALGGLGLAWTTNIWAGLALSTIGILLNQKYKIKARKLQSFRALTNASFIEFNNNLYNGDKIPFNFFDNDKDAPSTILYDSSTLQTSFEADLTSWIRSNRANKTLDTINIGQSRDEEGNLIFDSGNTFLLNGDVELQETPPKYQGYIIDSFKICSVGKCDISVEFIDINGDIAWTGIYQSEAKWTNNLREIWTEKNCSVFGRENMFFTEPVPYPEPLPNPVGDYVILKTTREYNINNVFSYENGNFNNSYSININNTDLELIDWRDKHKFEQVFESYKEVKITTSNNINNGEIVFRLQDLLNNGGKKLIYNQLITDSKSSYDYVACPNSNGQPGRGERIESYARTSYSFFGESQKLVLYINESKKALCVKLENIYNDGSFGVNKTDSGKKCCRYGGICLNPPAHPEISARFEFNNVKLIPYETN